jgi:hypothetical protein
VGSAGHGENNTKIGNREGWSMWKIDATINRFTFKSHPLQAASMGKRMRLFSGGGGDVIDPSAAMAVMGRLDSCAKVHVRGEGKHNKIMQQSTAYLIIQHSAGRVRRGDSEGVAFIVLWLEGPFGGSGNLMVEMFVARSVAVGWLLCVVVLIA